MNLVLLHAFPLHSGMYDPLRPLMADLATPETGGFGAAPLPDSEPSLSVLADRLVADLVAAGHDRFVLGGTSMGGYLAMEILRRQPQRIAGLALLDTKATADAEQARANRERIAASAERDGLDVVYADVEPGLLGETTRSTRPQVVAQVSDLIAAARPASVAWAQRAMARRQDSLEVLAGFEGPALVLRGAEDSLASSVDLQAMAEVLADVETVTVAGAGHLAALETPEPVAAALQRLVRRCGSG